MPVASTRFLHTALLVLELLDDRTAVTLCVTCHSAHAVLFHRYPIRRSFTQAELFGHFCAARMLFGTQKDSAEDGSTDEADDSADGEPEGTAGSQRPTMVPCYPAWCALSRGQSDGTQHSKRQHDDIDEASHDGYCVCCCSCCSPRVQVLRRWHAVDALDVFCHVKVVMIAHSAQVVLQPHTFPPGLRSLRLPGGFNSPIPPGSLPASLRHLVLGTYNQPLQPGTLPTELTHLSFDEYEHAVSADVLPSALQYLCLGYMYNMPMTRDSLPSQLRVLVLGVDWLLWHSWSTCSEESQARLLAVESDGSIMFDLEFRTQPGQCDPDGHSKPVQPLFDQPIDPGALPDTLLHLTLPKSFSQPLLPGALPPSLKSLLFHSKRDWHFDPGSHFNHPLLPGDLPTALELLCLPSAYNQTLVAGALPSSLTYLDAGEEELKADRGALPAGLHTLRVGRLCCDSLALDVLPASLAELQCNTMSHTLRSGVISQLPALRGLRADKTSRCELHVGSLPASLTSLDLSGHLDANHPVSLPVGVFDLCHSLRDVRLPDTYYNTLPAGLLPQSVQQLVLRNRLTPHRRFDEGCLPAALLHLCCSLHDPQDLAVLSQHPSLERLELTLVMRSGHVADAARGSCPPALTHLLVWDELNTRLSVRLWTGAVHMRELVVCGAFDQPLPPGCLPATLRRFALLSGQFNQQLKAGVLPLALEMLQLGDPASSWSSGFNQPIEPGVLPASLLHLSLEGAFNQPLLPGALPTALQTLTLGPSWQLDLPAGVLPLSLRRLRLKGRYKRRVLLERSLPMQGALRELLFDYKYRFALPEPRPPSLERWEDELQVKWEREVPVGPRVRNLDAEERWWHRWSLTDGMP